MDTKKKLVVAVLALSALSGCATGGAGVRSEEPSAAPAGAGTDTQEARAVLRPAPSYGSMGGYRYRRFIVVTIAPAS